MFFGEPFGGLMPGARGAVLSALLRTGAPLTGRQLHGVLGGRFSLWSVQQALKELEQIGIVETTQVGRAGQHRINEQHIAVASLRHLRSPFDLLERVVRDVVGDSVQAVIVFGSVGRGEAGPDSDVDLAVIARKDWDQAAELGEQVRERLGNACDVLHLTEADFTDSDHEPVIAEIVRDGVPMIGSLPRRKRRAAS